MAEDKIKAWIPTFRDRLGLDRKFQDTYEWVLSLDRNNIDVNSNAYPAAIAYISCVTSCEPRTQKRIANLTNCSVSQLQRSYSAIKKRHRGLGYLLG
ncbi:MAG: cyclin family protein [Candidatus Aenigmatarchaeota archaeon]